VSPSVSSELSLAGVAPGPAAAANVKSDVSTMCCHFSGAMGAWALVFRTPRIVHEQLHVSFRASILASAEHVR